MTRPGVLRRLTRPAPVYPEREDSTMLLPFAREGGVGPVLEVGCGSGVAALAAARLGACVVATDLNPHALSALRDRARVDGLDVRVVRTDLANGLGRFGRILANPPYLPTPPGSEDPDRWHHLAVDGGPDGLETTRRLLGALPNHLARGASAFVVFSSLQDAAGVDRLRRDWESAGGRWRRVAVRSLGGETLSVEELSRAEPVGSPGATYVARRSRATTPGTGGRRRTPRPSRRGSTTGSARGRTRAPGGASGRRRSPRGS